MGGGLSEVFQVVTAELGLESRPPEFQCSVLHPVLHFRVPQPSAQLLICPHPSTHATPERNLPAQALVAPPPLPMPIPIPSSPRRKPFLPSNHEVTTDQLLVPMGKQSESLL